MRPRIASQTQLQFESLKAQMDTEVFAWAHEAIDLVAQAVALARGRGVAYQPDEFVRFQASYGEDQKKVVAAYSNVTAVTGSLGGLDLPDGLDMVLTVQNYHDLHLTPFPKDTAAKVNAEVFKSLKPGGVYLVVDHVAAPGSGLDAAMKVYEADDIDRSTMAARIRHVMSCAFAGKRLVVF